MILSNYHEKKAYIATNNFDVVRLAKTFLDPRISNDDNRINIARYSLLTADHSSTRKREVSVFICKDFLPLVKKDDIADLKECLLTEITVDTEICFFTCLYRSRSKNYNQFSDFCKDYSIFIVNNINEH